MKLAIRIFALSIVFVGVAAAYRDIRNAQWRAESGTVEKGVADLLKKNKIAIAVNRASIGFSD